MVGCFGDWTGGHGYFLEVDTIGASSRRSCLPSKVSAGESVRVVGYSISEKGTINTDGESPEDSLLEFLLVPKKDAIRLFYHLEFNVAGLLRQLRISRQEGMELLYTTKLHFYPYKLRYIPGKLFSAKREGAFSYFGDANQYVHYPSRDLLEEPAVLAGRAGEVGGRVCEVLEEMGIEPTSLVNPARSYEKEENPLPTLEKVVQLYLDWKEKGKSELRGVVVQRIIHGITEVVPEVATDGVVPVSLDVAIRKRQWGKLGKLLEEEGENG